jgi:hypothetical protein
MMREAGDWKPDTSVQHAMLRFLDQMFPDIDDRSQFAELCGRFEDEKLEGAVVTLKEASFMKLFCDAYFMQRIKLASLAKSKAAMADDASPSKA